MKGIDFMINNEILESIDNINNVENDVSLDTSLCILEYYGKMADIIGYCNDSDSFDNIVIFQEAADTTAAKKKEGIGSKIMNAIRQFINAIRNAFASLFGKVSKGASDASNGVKEAINDCKKKASRKRSENLLTKLSNFRKEHPVVFTLGAVAAGGGVLYGGSKALDAGGKAHAMKELSKEDKELISKYFDQDTDTVTIPYELNDIFVVAKTGHEKYKKILDKFMNDLGLVGDNEPTTEKCDKYFKNSNNFSSLISDIKGIETDMAQKNILSGFSGKTTIPGGLKGWNKTMSKYESIINDSEQCDAIIMSLSDILYDAILKISDDKLRNECANKFMSEITSILQRHTKAMNDITNIQMELMNVTTVLDNFLPKYYAVANKIDTVKSDIVECLEVAAKLVSIALNKPSENEVREISELRKKKYAIEDEYKRIKSDVDSLKLTRGRLVDSVNELTKKKKELDETIAKIKTSSGNDNNDSSDKTDKIDNISEDKDDDKGDRNN